MLLNNRFLKIASFTVVLLLVTSVAGQNLPAYAVHYNHPSFGNEVLTRYADGLTINGKTFDISQFSQISPSTQILPIAKSSTITLKIFDNAGPTTIRAVQLSLNIHNKHFSKSDTTIIYSLKNNAIYLTDPHQLLASVTADYKIDQQYAYVTFYITPNGKMDTSSLIVSAMDDKRAVTNARIIDAIQFS